MPRPQWKDVTSYSRRVGLPDKIDEEDARSWELAINGLRLVVTRKLHRDGWYTECHGFARFGSGTARLESEKIEDAKREALEMLDKLLDDVGRDVRDVRAQLLFGAPP